MAGSFERKVEVSMKKVSSSTVTSLIAVMSMNVLFFAIFTLPIVRCQLIGFTMFLLSQLQLFVCCGVGSYDGETDFVDSVSQVVDLIGEEVVGNYSECTGADTECGVHKGFRDTG